MATKKPTKPPAQYTVLTGNVNGPKGRHQIGDTIAAKDLQPGTNIAALIAAGAIEAL